MLTVVEGRFDSAAERQIHHYIQAADLPGIAVFNVYAKRRSKSRARQIDAIIWTPTACVVLEIKGFTQPQSGGLTASANGAWTIDGQPVAIHCLAGEANPFHQARERIYDLRHHLERELAV
ncbi:nuclease-related domain-containing protein [Nocardia farcinica]|uniref:nuclease-related domain-containing protein n=1 Tax=Nocardia farcinica TaxID=37329 RepID=UPI002455FE5D|nr:nuclease-related domain-containing protein [Nocardia farcinica]